MPARIKIFLSFILVVIMAVGLGLFFNSQPYHSWIQNKNSFRLGMQGCPVQWNFNRFSIQRFSNNTQAQTDERIQVIESLLVAPEHSNFTNALRNSHLEGHGVDTFSHNSKHKKPYFTNIDAQNILGFQIYNLRNGSEDIVNIVVPGLANVHGAELTILADDTDVIYIDDCLKWGVPRPVPLKDLKWIVPVYDTAGQRATIIVKGTSNIRPLSRDRVKNWSDARYSTQ